jgi:flagellar basal-body rod protein FlgG
MQDALYIAAIGLQAQQQQLDASSNNFANLNTTAYKRQSVDFSAVLDAAPAGASVPVSGKVDAQPNSVLRFDFTPGAVHATGRALDMAITDGGFVQVELPDNSVGYSRGGSLQINADGVLALASGEALKDDIRIPNGATNVQVLSDGSVTASLPGESISRVLGQIELASFTNPDALRYRGNGIFTLPDTSTQPILARPGDQGSAPLAVQSLEGSNVDMTNEMVSLTLMQRIYELNSRVAQVADELMGMANDMRRG